MKYGSFFPLCVSLMLLSILSACRNDSSSGSDGLIHVDVTKDYPEKEFLLQDLFEVEYVRLETSDDFLTAGFVLEVSDHYVVSRNTNIFSGDFYLFDRQTGKGVAHLNRKGQGGEEYTNLLDLLVDEQAGELYLNSHFNKMIYVYNFEGNFKRSFKQQGVLFYNRIGLLGDYLIADDDQIQEIETGPQPLRDHFLVLSKADGQVVQAPSIPYERKIPLILYAPDGSWECINLRKMEPCDGDWLLVETSADTIYRMDASLRLTPYIVRTPSVQEEERLFLFPSLYGGKRYQFMCVVKNEYDFQQKEGFPRTNLVYDSEEKALYRSTLYNGDMVDSEPINTSSRSFTYRNMNDRGVAFTQTLFAHELVEAYQEGRLKGRLKEIAATLGEEDNPVILIAKYKR